MLMLNCGSRAGRRGVSTLQLILALPVLMIVSIAIFQFGIVMIVQQSITTAATEGARAAATEANPAAAHTAALAAVNKIMAVHGLSINGTSALRTEYGTSPAITSGGLNCSPPAAPLMMNGEVRVSVCIDLTTKPLLNALSTLGLSFTGKRLEISSLTSKE